MRVVNRCAEHETISFCRLFHKAVDRIIVENAAFQLRAFPAADTVMQGLAAYANDFCLHTVFSEDFRHDVKARTGRTVGIAASV